MNIYIVTVKLQTHIQAYKRQTGQTGIGASVVVVIYVQCKYEDYIDWYCQREFAFIFIFNCILFITARVGARFPSVIVVNVHMYVYEIERKIYKEMTAT